MKIVNIRNTYKFNISFKILTCRNFIIERIFYFVNENLIMECRLRSTYRFLLYNNNVFRLFITINLSLYT